MIILVCNVEYVDAWYWCDVSITVPILYTNFLNISPNIHISCECACALILHLHWEKHQKVSLDIIFFCLYMRGVCVEFYIFSTSNQMVVEELNMQLSYI